MVQITSRLFKHNTVGELKSIIRPYISAAHEHINLVGPMNAAVVAPNADVAAMILPDRNDKS